MLLAAAALALAACGSTPRENFYTLSEGLAPPAAAGAALSVQVGAVTVPQAVDRTAMVLRTGPNQVDIDDLHRWVEPLKSAIPRALAELLMRELGTPRVTLGGAKVAGATDYRVAVDVVAFESSLTDGATLDAAWSVTPPQGPPKTGRTFAQEPANPRDHAGIAAAHRRALGKLAREIAAAIRS